jgi:cytochrome d ubiquinol oxidase subunit I
VIEGVLPTFMAVSSISAANVATTLIGFIVFYTTLAIVDVYLMVKAIRQGPGEAAGSEAMPSMVPAE